MNGELRIVKAQDRFNGSIRTPRLRAKRPAPYQPWATPKEGFFPTEKGLKARHQIVTQIRRQMDRAFSPHAVCGFHPWADARASLWPRLVWSRAFGPQSRRSRSRRGLFP